MDQTLIVEVQIIIFLFVKISDLIQQGRFPATPDARNDHNLFALHDRIGDLPTDEPLIPLLGLICCLYMMSELGVSNWIGFSIWLAIGLVIYFLYGYKNSKLNKKSS